MAKYRLFYSPRCPSCTRLIAGLQKLPAVRAQTELVDVDGLTPDQFARLQGRLTAVPTLVTDDGQVHAGTAAFRFIDQFQGEAELDAYSLVGHKGIGFSVVESADGLYNGHVQFADRYSDFNGDGGD